MPHAGHLIPPHAVLVEARVVTVDGRLVLACVRSGDGLDLAALSHELGGVAMEALPAELPERLAAGGEVIPPLGKLLGLPLIVDEDVENCTTLVFHGRAYDDYFELPYEDFARLEQPRIASFARAGELEQAPGTRAQRGAGA
jgi:prolyl-tRNA editing enzyme YbaK/EbsC (Cys-tRNA(Pro) deacylase)